MDDRGRPHRGPGRFLAPLALAATIAGVFLIVSGNSGSGSGGAGGGSTSSSQHGRSGSANHPSSGQTGKHQAAHGHSGGQRGHGGSPAGGSAGASTAGTTEGTTGGTTTAPTTSTASTTGTSTTATTGPGAKFYVVQPGDTMEVISVKTHVPLATIEALNPSVSSNAMSVGQRIRIRK